MYIWQSWVEIEHYSIAYFNLVNAFEVLQHRTSIEGGAHMCCVNMSDIRALCSVYEPRL